MQHLQMFDYNNHKLGYSKNFISVMKYLIAHIQCSMLYDLVTILSLLILSIDYLQCMQNLSNSYKTFSCAYFGVYAVIFR